LSFIAELLADQMKGDGLNGEERTKTGSIKLVIPQSLVGKVDVCDYNFAQYPSK
jgi:hypothetical protein